MENIDKIFFINLEKRPDRRNEIMREINDMDFPKEKIERFVAIERGQVGCVLSHLEILKIAKERHYRNILILEDDFHFIVDRPTFDHEIRSFFQKNVNFYVLMLSYLCTHSKLYDNQLSIGLDCQDGSGYIVNESAFDELAYWLTYGAENLFHTEQHWIYMNDQIWKKMQTVDRWFIFNRRLGLQNGSHSDLANT